MQRDNPGSALPSPVGPTGRVINTNPLLSRRDSALSGTNSKTSEVTPTGQVRDEEAAQATTPDIDGTKYGTVVYDIDPLGSVFTDALPKPDFWYPADAWKEENISDRVLLYADYQHGAARPNKLPKGYGFIRLDAGSLPVGASKWDADLTDNQGYELQAPESTPLMLVAAAFKVVELGQTTDYIDLHFNYVCDFSAPAGNYSLARLATIKFSTNGGIPLYAMLVEATRPKLNQIRLRLPRWVALSEGVSIQLPSGIVKRTDSAAVNLPSVEIAVGRPLAINCTVLVVNRTIEAISAGSKVIIGKSMTVPDVGNTQVGVYAVTAYDVLPMGGGGTALAVAKIMGGNAFPTLASPQALTPARAKDPLYDEQGYKYDEDYPTYRVAAYPMPQVTKANEIMLLPQVKDWSKFALPATYKFDDPLPRVPDGISYIRLERPYQIGSAGWSSFLDASDYVGKVPTFTPISVIGVKSKKDADDTILITFNQPVEWRVLTNAPKNFTVIAVPQRAILAQVKLKVSTATVRTSQKNVVELQLDKDMDMDDYTYIVSMLSSALKTVTVPAMFAPNVMEFVTPTTDKATMLLGLNRNSYQYYTRGDVVVISSKGTNITDSLGVSVPVFDILMPFGSVMTTHDHAQAAGGFSGGGPAFAQIINAANTGVSNG